MLKKTIGTIIAAIFILCGIVSAQESVGNPYTNCGIGAAIFPTVGWAAATSNATWDLGTTAIISALASPGTCSSTQVDTAQLILESVPQIEREIALGGGEYLTALGAISDCDEVGQALIVNTLRNEYVNFVVSADYAERTEMEKAVAIYGSVKAGVDSSSGACSAVL